MNSLVKPPRESRPWALWIWNLSIRRSEMLDQTKAFAEKGFAGVAIRPGREMDPPFLSEEFVDLFGTVLDCAAQTGLSVRLADDFFLNWSGVFQPLALRDMSARAQKLSLSSVETLSAGASFERIIENPGSQVCMAVKLTNGKPDLDQVRQVPASSGKSLFSWKVPTGDWRLLVFSKEYIKDPAGHYSPNTFNHAVADYYIDTVLEPLRARFSKHVPAVFEGFINEMPPFIPQDKAIPWNDDLVTKFRTRYKKELLNLLPDLFQEIEPSQGKNRVQVQEFLLRSMYDGFAMPLEAWAKKHRLTQWVLCPERSMCSETDIKNSYFLIPDNPFSGIGFQNQDGTETNYAGLRAMADMNATQYRRKTLTVLGRNSQGTSSSIQDLKYEIDRNFFAGPSTVIIDGLFSNLDRRGHGNTPFSPFWYSSEWDSAKLLCDYAARLSLLAGQSHYSRDVAVLMPSSSVLAECAANSSEAAPKGFTVLGKVVAELERLSFSFDVVSEELLLACAIRTSGEFGTADRIRKGNYFALVVPHCWLMSRSLFAFLEKLAAKKGRILFIDEIPQGTLEDGVSETFASRMEKLLAAGGTAEVIPLKNLGGVIARLATPVARVTVQGKTAEDVVCSRLSGTEFETYVFHNASTTQEHLATIEVPGEKHACFLDAATGTLEDIDPYRVANGHGILQLNFLPRQIIFVILSSMKLAPTPKGRKGGIAAAMTQPKNYRVILKNEWEFAPGSMNVLPLAAWNTRIGLSREFGGYSHFYEAYFEIKDLPSQCLLLSGDIPGLGWDALSPDNLVEVTVNGNHIEENRKHLVITDQPEADNPYAALIAANPYLKGAVVYDIRGSLDKGFNRVTIRTAGSQGIPPVIVYPPILAGDFAIEKGLRGWTITMQRIPVGNDTWTNYGYPYLAGIGIYRQVFEIPSEYKQLILRCSHLSGSIHVSLNGKDMGFASWSPFQFDITAACDSKRNELVIRVANTIDNMLKLTRRPSGVRGEIDLDVY